MKSPTIRSMYYLAHPLIKTAAVLPPGLFTNVVARGKKFLSSPYGHIRDYMKENPLATAGAGAALVGGTWLGNKAYEAQIPQVRALPRLEQRPMINPYYQN